MRYTLTKDFTKIPPEALANGQTKFVVKLPERKKDGRIMLAQTYIDLTDLGEFKTKQDAFNEEILCSV